MGCSWGLDEVGGLGAHGGRGAHRWGGLLGRSPIGVRVGVDGKGLGHLDLPGRWTRNEPTLRTCGDNKVSVGGNPMVGVPCGCFLPVERQGRKTGDTFAPERDPREQVVERRLLTVTRREGGVAGGGGGGRAAAACPWNGRGGRGGARA